MFNYCPLFSCEGHDSKDNTENAAINNDDDNDKKTRGHKKGKGKKHKSSDNDNEDPEDNPDSFIRGETPGREPVLELD